MHPHNCWVEWFTTGCIRFFPIGYLCWFGFCIAWDVSNNINPHKRSKNGFKIEAIIDNDLLSIEGKTINAKSTMLAMFVTRIAILSRLSFISSAWQSVNKLTKKKKKKNQFLFSGKRDRFYLKIDFFFFFFLATLQTIIKRKRHRKINREGNEQSNNLVSSFRVLLWITIMYL